MGDLLKILSNLYVRRVYKTLYVIVRNLKYGDLIVSYKKLTALALVVHNDSEAPFTYLICIYISDNIEINNSGYDYRYRS